MTDPTDPTDSVVTPSFMLSEFVRYINGDIQYRIIHVKTEEKLSGDKTGWQSCLLMQLTKDLEYCQQHDTRVSCTNDLGSDYTGKWIWRIEWLDIGHNFGSPISDRMEVIQIGNELTKSVFDKIINYIHNHPHNE